MRQIKRKSLLVVPTLIAMLLSGNPVSAASDGNYEKAVTSYEAERFDSAFIHLKNALQDDPNHLAARVLLAKLYLHAGDLKTAEKEAGEALLLGADINLVLPIYGTSLVLQKKVDELFALEQSFDSFTPENKFEWLLLKGQGYIANNEPELALAEFEKAAKQFPTDVRANNTLATIYLRFELYSQAREVIDRSLLLDPKNEKTWQLSGELAMLEQDFTTAKTSFEKAFALDNNDPKVLRSLAKLQFELGNAKELRRYLDLILQQSPGDPAATLLNAVMLLSDGETELGSEMLADLSNKLSYLDDENFKTEDGILFIHAAADYAQRNDESATTLLNAYIGKHPDELIAIRMLVDIYLRNGQEKNAQQLLSDRRSSISSDFGLTLQLIQLNISQNNILGAQELLEDAKKTAPGHPQVTLLEAEFLRARNQSGSALALLQGHNFGGTKPIGYWLLKGKLELDLKMYPAAKGTTKQLLEFHPNSLSARNFASVAYLKMGQWRDALPHIEFVLENDPENTNAKFNRALLHKQLGELDKANTLANEILAEHPEHISSILLISRILSDKGEYENAIEWSKKVYNYNIKDLRPAEFQLALYRQTGNWKKALDIAQQLNKRDRLNTSYMVQLAQIYTHLEQYKQAQRPLNKLFVLWEHDARKLRELAALQVRSSNFPGARKSLETALQQDMLNYGTRLDLARLTLKEGNSEAAKMSVEKLKAEFGQTSQLELLSGEIQLLEDNLPQAQDHFTNALEKDPRNTAALLHLYELGTRGYGEKEFVELMEKRVNSAPQPAWVIKLLADSYLIQGNTSLAAKHYESLVAQSAYQDNPAILNNLANIYSKTDLDKALKTALKGTQDNDTKNPALLDTIGWILAQQDRHEEALPYFRQAYTMNSTDAEIRYHTAVALLALGRDQEAERELRAAIALGDDFADSQEARRLLRGLSK